MKESDKYKYTCEETGRTCYSDLNQEQIDRLKQEFSLKPYSELAKEFGVSEKHIQYLGQTFGLHRQREHNRQRPKQGKEVYMEKNGNKRYCYHLVDAANLLGVDVQTIRNSCNNGTLCNGWHLEWGDV